MPGIVVGIDGSHHSTRALEWALKEAAIQQAQLTVLTAHSVPASPWTGSPLLLEGDQRISSPGTHRGMQERGPRGCRISWCGWVREANYRFGRQPGCAARTLPSRGGAERAMTPFWPSRLQMLAEAWPRRRGYCHVSSLAAPGFRAALGIRYRPA
jgi:Universal stress protein family